CPTPTHPPPSATSTLLFSTPPPPPRPPPLPLPAALPTGPPPSEPAASEPAPAEAAPAEPAPPAGADQAQLDALDAAETSSYWDRSEEHTSELQSLTNLVCRLLLEKKKTHNNAKPDL